MLTVAKASWSAGTQTAVVSPLGAYASVIAARVRRDHCFGVVAFLVGSSKLSGGNGDNPGAYSSCRTRATGSP